jgi:hypothetical protein
MKSIENTSVVGVRTAEITVEISIEYFLFEDRNFPDVAPNLERI